MTIFSGSNLFVIIQSGTKPNLVAKILATNFDNLCKMVTKFGSQPNLFLYQTVISLVQNQSW